MAWEQVDRLVARIVARPQHGAGCSCCAGPGLIRLRPADVERMVVALLRDRYRKAGEDALERIMTRWLLSEDPPPLAIWLSEGKHSGTRDVPGARIGHDILASLQQLADPDQVQ